jgi:hypothetical protein
LQRDGCCFHPARRKDIPYGVAYDEAVVRLSFELSRSQTKEIRSGFGGFDIICGEDRAVR